MQYLRIEDEINYSRKRYEIRRKIEDMFIAEGFVHIEPSVFEDFDKFTSLNKRAKKESMVKVISGGSDVLILRPDITTNLIKGLIPRWQNNLKLKLFYSSTIFRSNDASNVKEIRQMGVEYLGEASLKADKEVVLIALRVLKNFNDKFILEMSSSKYIHGLLKEIDVDESGEKEVKDLIYRKNRYELLNYMEGLNLSEKIYDTLANLMDLQGSIEAVEASARKYYLNDEMEEAIAELKELNDFIVKEGYKNYVHYDLSMVTELDYYDGLIFKGYLPNSYTAIISGGRYDSFTEVFGKKVPAIGFCIDIDELTEIKFEEAK
ncbi:MAG: ATP phosphoribosyltransferase regulatory subunit [Lutispora sp.]|nr:ATP phosphoribosyltransferase regulatory subunit [Lutispora sp.]MDD4834122.1 ATP phosphoribosyltransferase regulatory subunit [Lutispora sp.]